MAGLFELQLPNKSRSPGSQIPGRRLSTSSGIRSNSPSPADTARDIVNQVVAKREAAAAASAGSNIFPWKRRTTPQRPPRLSSDASPRNSGDVSGGNDSQSPDRARKHNEKIFSRPTTDFRFPSSPTSLRISSPVDFALTTPTGSTSDVTQEPSTSYATSALAHAGLGIGFPPVSYPFAGPPSSVTKSTMRKTSRRPLTAHRPEGASSSALSYRVDHVRRVKSFPKNESIQNVDEWTSGNQSDKGNTLVFTPGAQSLAAPHIHSMPEFPLRETKGKEREKAPAFDVEITSTLENPRSRTRGRQLTSPPHLSAGNREHSASRRTSWWPGRRRVDSSAMDPPPSLPPPVPQRSQARSNASSGDMTPSLPIFRPFSPLMGEFTIIAESVISSEGRDVSTRQGIDGVILNLAEGEAAIRRRHSLNNRNTGTQHYVTTTSNQPPSRPPSQVHSPMNRSSWSMNLPTPSGHDSSSQTTNSLGPPAHSFSSDVSSETKTQSGTFNIRPARRRSMTVNSTHQPSIPSSSRDIPLLLRHPTSRPSTAAGPPDPFLTGWGVGSGTHASVETPEESLVLPIEMRRTPSTSSGSTSSFPHPTPAPPSPQYTTVSPTRALTVSNMSASLPPPASNLLRRLSSTLFSSASTPVASLTEQSQAVPIDSNSTANLSTTFHHSSAENHSPATSDESSPLWSRENLPSGEGSRSSAEVTKSKILKYPTRITGETPEEYVRRLTEVVSKAEVAYLLADSGDSFQVRALRFYIDRFDFLDDPLDVALRKLLMDLRLPRETQQIDRVMEAFAARYIHCNPGLFENNDHPYILAFSLIMLHTDAFNKSNKNKMTKTDYVKNARLPGVPPEILECFFDNIVFAPFIFIEDPMDVNASKGNFPESASRINTINGPTVSTPGGIENKGSTILNKSNKIDPYFLITQGLLGPLRADVVSHIPQSNPFLFEGTDWPWDTRRLHHVFAAARVVYVPGDSLPSPAPPSTSISTVSIPMRRKSIAFPSSAVGHGPFIGSSPFNLDGLPSSPRVPMLQGSRPGSIRVITAGVLARKEDLLENGKRSTNRKWREWSVVLTGSQLLFFRDTNFVSQLSGRAPMDGHVSIAPELGLMNPDEVVSLVESIALFDITYKKYGNTFRLSMPTGRQFLCQAPDGKSLNEWISTINYASAFKTAGISVRGFGMSHKDVEMMGVAAAVSHLQDLRSSKLLAPSESLLAHPYTSPNTLQSVEMSPSRPQSSSSPAARIGPGSKLLRPFTGAQSQVDLEMRMPNDLEGAQQLKATFEEVKAELAARNAEMLQPSYAGRVRTLSMGAQPMVKTPTRPATAGASLRPDDDTHHSISRNDILQSLIDNWDSNIGRIQQELNRELLIARNLAILTPFQRATRDRIQLAVFPLAKKIRSLRIELTKLICYRFVLLSDLADEERHLDQAKRDALQAAAQELSTAERLSTVHKDTLNEHSSPISRMSSSLPAAESRHSTLDEPGGSSNPSISQPTTCENGMTHRPVLPKIRTSARDNNAVSTRSSSDKPVLSDTTQSQDVSGHERFYTAAETPEEIAEKWNETRAAKRVSLVKLPPEVKLSSVFGKQRNPNDDLLPRMLEYLPPSSPIIFAPSRL